MGTISGFLNRWSNWFFFNSWSNSSSWISTSLTWFAISLTIGSVMVELTGRSVLFIAALFNRLIFIRFVSSRIISVTACELIFNKPFTKEPAIRTAKVTPVSNLVFLKLRSTSLKEVWPFIVVYEKPGNCLISILANPFKLFDRSINAPVEGSYLLINLKIVFSNNFFDKYFIPSRGWRKA